MQDPAAAEYGDRAGADSGAVPHPEGGVGHRGAEPGPPGGAESARAGEAAAYSMKSNASISASGTADMFLMLDKTLKNRQVFIPKSAEIIRNSKRRYSPCNRGYTA